jgi:hypothetical protein
MSLIPSDQTIYGNLNVSGAITSFTNQVGTDPFGELKVVQRSMVIDLKSVFGISVLRDTVTTTGTGTVTNVIANPEFTLATSAANDTAILQSAERGRYCAGYGAQCGIAMRIPAAFTGNQAVRFGYTDSTNGFFYLYNSTGISVGIVRGGTETIIPQSSWNVDKLNGTGPSARTLDMTRGNIFRMDFSWYGFGSVSFNIVITDTSGNQVVQTVHRWAPNQQTSVLTPNLPIYVGLQNGGTAAPATVYVAGRQFSLYGNYSPIYRISSFYDTSPTVLTTTGFAPILSVKRRLGSPGMGLKMSSYDISSSDTIIVQIRVNPTLTGATYNTVQDSPSTESMLQYDVAATAMSGGTVIYCQLVMGAQAKVEASTASEQLFYNIPEYQPVTICAKAVNANVTATITVVFRLKEEY